MRARHYAFTPEAASATSIAAVQTLAAAGNVNLNGTYGAHGFGYLVTPTKNQLRPAWQITLTAVGDVSTVDFTITYLDAYLNQQTVTVAGPNATTSSLSIYAVQILSVTTDDAAADISIGHIVVGYAPWKGLPFRRGYPGCTVSVGISGTANYTVETTYANLSDNDIFDGTFDLYDHASLTAKTASAFGVMADRVTAVRLKINSWTSGEIRMDFAVPMVG